MLTACHAQLRFRVPFWVRPLRVSVSVRVRVRLRVRVRIRYMPCTAEV